MSAFGLRVALSGSVGGESRARFRERLEAVGAEYAATLDEQVDVLVVGDEPLSSKVSRAEELGIRVVDWPSFRVELEGGGEPTPLATPSSERHPALVSDLHHVRVLDRRLPRRAHPVDAIGASLVPEPRSFSHYTLDTPTLALLRFLARAVVLKQPALIEGETATSKTSAIRYLASWVGQPVARLNLNGQTDTGELVGKFVPAPDGGWVFREGLVPQAMRHGWWLVLDEVNLADPAVLERLNPVLERQPSLVLTEGDGARIGPGGVALHDDFRVFATMNPAEYQGRSVLSPAWRDRFVATWQARSPEERELRQMLRRLVLGEQPVVELAGGAWQGPHDEAAPHRSLAVDGVDGLLARLAALWAALSAMAGPGAGRGATLGVRRREGYVFSRRGLLAVMDGLAGARRVGADGVEVGFAEAPEATVLEVLEDMVVQRVRGEEDRALVGNVLRSLGLAGDSWIDPFGEG